jgi:MoxR-like ATPase
VTEVSESATPQKSNGSAAGSFPERFDALVRTAAHVIQGKDDVLRKAIVCMLAEGHVLLEDVPGVGKTSLARALAHTVKVDWNRIQFTPDLLPSDVTGVSIFNQSNMEFEFRAGPIFANLVVGDEINRASPKTQSALLEVMEEGNVTVDGNTYRVPRPFMVVATQNPIDIEGTYRLPEAQLDRFLMRLSMGYPDHEAERRVLRTQKNGSNAESLTPVTDAKGITAMIEEARAVEVAAAAEDYIINLATATRQAPEVRLGLSPRGSLALLRASRVVALANGRQYVTPEDVKDLVPEVVTHRIIITPEAELQGHTPDEVVARALASVPVPRAATGS